MLAADNINVAQNVAFGIIAAVMVFAALCVVTTKNVVHAALWLVIVLAGVAAQYILAAAEFVAVSQVLVYVGAVMVLFLFGIMLTRAQIGKERGLNNRNWGWGIPVAVVLLGLLSYVIIDAFDDQTLPDQRPDADRGARRPDPVALPGAVPGHLVRPPRRRHRRHRPGPQGLSAMLDRSNFLLARRGAVLHRRVRRVARRNAVMVLMSVELILNAVNLNLIAFALMHGNVDGQVFALYVIAVAAAEVGVGLGDGAARVPQPAVDQPRRAQRDEGLAACSPPSSRPGGSSRTPG